MTYTIEELEALLGDFGTRLEAAAPDITRQLIATMRALEAAQARIVELETFDSPVTLLEHAQMKARIEAAAAIGEDVAAQDFPLYYAYSDGANSMRAQFRKALEIE